MVEGLRRPKPQWLDLQRLLQVGFELHVFEKLLVFRIDRQPLARHPNHHCAV